MDTQDDLTQYPNQARVTITAGPDLLGAQRKTALGYSILVLGNFKGTPDGQPLADREIFRFKKGDFNAQMKRLGPSAEFKVRNTLTKELDKLLGVDLHFDGMESLGPEGLGEQVPETKLLLEKLRSLQETKRRARANRKFERKLEQAFAELRAQRTPPG
jgi:type VI secretion system ImpB/VipA family protein